MLEKSDCMNLGSYILQNGVSITTNNHIVKGSLSYVVNFDIVFFFG